MKINSKDSFKSLKKLKVDNKNYNIFSLKEAEKKWTRRYFKITQINKSVTRKFIKI